MDNARSIQGMQQGQGLKLTPKMVMSPHMQQAIRFMQIPVMALAAEIEEQMAENPLLEYSEEVSSDEEPEEPLEQGLPPEQEIVIDENDFDILKHLDQEFEDYFAESGQPQTHHADADKRKTFLDSMIQATPSLFEMLMEQANQTFPEPDRLVMAQAIIGNLNEQGFFQMPLEELALSNDFDEGKLKEILETIKTFDPPGIGASSIQESLLIQLRYQHKESSFAYRLIELCYDDLIHNRIPLIEKRLQCSAEKIRRAIDVEIGRLDIHPGTQFANHLTQTVRPDVFLRQEGDALVVEGNRDDIPHVRLNMKYLRMLNDDTVASETKAFIHHHLLSAKWLMRTLQQRETTIERIGMYLAEYQREFFMNPEGKLVPLTMKTVAEALELHESTVARAVANKYINTPRGLLPLRDFFTNGFLTSQGEDFSSTSVREAIQRIIDGENKHTPLSDQEISNTLHQAGIPCARRTVAKYRVELSLASALQRKKF
jgi:RNA polymerase sigma-54 factor